MALDNFHPAVAAWFRRAFESPTPAQLRAWPAIQSGRHALIAAPTGSGKTLAAFLAAIDDLVRRGIEAPLPDETFVVYVSPLKALSNDIRINLEAPLNGIRDELMILGLPDVEIRTSVRTGDTPQAERDRMRRQPPHIVVTTPESLYILLGSESGRMMLGSTRTVIIDEIHALAPNKRGAHLALSLERLEALCGRRLTRIGLSATQKPIEEVARFLVGACERPLPASGRLPPQAGEGNATHLGEPPFSAERAAPATTSGAGSFPQEKAEGKAVHLREAGPSRVERQIREVSAATSGNEPFPCEAGEGGGSRKGAASRDSAKIECEIVDVGYSRRRDLAIELPPTPLQAVMSGDVWSELYTRLAELIEQHRTTLVFVNTRRMAERLARHLSEKLGKEAVTSHHGSLAREQRLAAEQRLKRGELRALVATASLELGIDIGDVDLVCQIASPRSISTFLQRVGRSGHSVGGTPKGRLFALSRDDLIECTALLDAVRRSELDTLHVERDPLDVLAQQLVAEIACREWNEDELFGIVRRAYPFCDLPREKFTEIVRMLADGYATRRGPRAAYLHRDAVNGVLRARRGARLTALTSGGAIPDTADYEVVLEPQAQKIGTVHEDFAVESMAGDIFQLGNTSYRVLRVERGTVRVEDAQGLPPTLPFWLGEAPGRSDELSAAVSRLRAEVSARLGLSAPFSDRERRGGEGPASLERDGDAEPSPAPPLRAAKTDNRSTPLPEHVEVGHLLPRAEGGAFSWLTDAVGVSESAARQIVEYLGGAKAAFGMLPTQQVLAMERFFDESGGMQLIIHSPFGSRLNRAWGLALRKRFCRSFNFELQAAATEDAIILSLSTSHSFPLDDVTRYLHSNTVREVLIQALLDAPMFGLRWRWNATTALALPRFVGGNKVPPQLQRMKSEDLLATVFPDQVACLENIVGERQIPDHPLVAQTLYDCLHQAMDIEGLEALLRRLESGQIHFVCRDLTAPSPLAAEILNSRPYTFLDDAPLEERRTQAVMSRRWGDIDSTDDFGKLDAEAIAAVREEAWPEARNADELHEALMGLGFLTAYELGTNVGWSALLDQLIVQRRATRVALEPLFHRERGRSEGPGSADGMGEAEPSSAPPPRAPEERSSGHLSSQHVEVGQLLPDREGKICVATERLPEFKVIFPNAELQPPVEAPPEFASADWTREAALVELVRGRLTGLGPVRAADIAVTLHLPQVDIDTALIALETEGYAMRGRFTPNGAPTDSAQGRADAAAMLADAENVARLGRDRFPADRGRMNDSTAAGVEWCERHLLARIHRYTVKRLRREIEPVSPRDFMRFLFEWQHVAPGTQVSGPDALAAVLAQLEGCEVAAAAWESEILPARVAGYEISWLDDLCLAGRIAWSRLRAPVSRDNDDGSGSRASGPVRATPIVLLQRRNMPSWTALAASSQATPPLSSRAQAVADELKDHGASFFDELAGTTHLLQTELEDALSELVAAGMVTSDSYAGLRALLLPPSRRPSTTRRRGRRTALFGIADAGRWSLLRRHAPPAAKPRAAASASSLRSARADKRGSDPELIEFVAHTLLKRYGVICWRLLAREPQWLPPWRELLRVYHRLEARGEIRGGRFIAGLTGEQFALPEAIGLMRGVRGKAHDGALVSISGADPLNLVGYVVAGNKVPNQAGARVLYRDGAPIATLVGGQFNALEAMDEAAEWAARSKLLRAQSEYAAVTADESPAVENGVPMNSR
jgi:ATP-dependent Lhr-like helicase